MTGASWRTAVLVLVAVPASALAQTAGLEARVAERMRVEDLPGATAAMREVVRVRLAAPDTLWVENVDALVLYGRLLLSQREHFEEGVETANRAMALARTLDARGAWGDSTFALAPALRAEAAFAHAFIGAVQAADTAAGERDLHDARRLQQRALLLVQPLLAAEGDSVQAWLRWTAFGMAGMGLAQTQGKLGNFAAGVEVLEIVLHTLRGAPRPDGAQLGALVEHYGALLQRRGDGSGASRFVGDALAVLVRAPVPEIQKSVPRLIAAADRLQQVEQYPAAHHLCEFVWMLGRLENHRDAGIRARGQVCMADVALALGDLANARLRYARAEREMNEGGVTDPAFRARMAMQAGGATYLDGDTAGALQLLEESLAHLRRATRPDDGTRLVLLAMRTELLADAGRLDEARAQREEAVRLLDVSAMGGGNREMFRLWAAGMLLREGRHPDALRQAEDVLARLRASREPASFTAAATDMLARILLHPAVGRAPEAAEHLLRLAPWIDTQAREVLPRLSRAEQIGFVNRHVFPYAPLLAQAALATGDPAPHYAFFGGWKGVLVQQLRRGAVPGSLAAGDSAAAAEWRRYGELRARLAVAHARAAADSSLDALSESERLTREIEELERRMARAAPAGALEDPWGGTEGLRRRLAPDAAFVDVHYVPRWVLDGDGPHYLAVILTRAAPPAILDLGPSAPLDSVLADWTDWTVRGGAPDHRQRELARRLWLPVAEALPPRTAQVWVSPDAQLSRAPWAVLAGELDDTRRLRVGQVVSGRHLAALLDAPAAPSGRDVLLVGGVDFGPPADSARAFRPLPGTARELRDVAALADRRGWPVLALSGAFATEEAVAAALPSARYVHLSTHGIFSREPAGREGGRGGIAALVADSGRQPVALRWLARRNPLLESGLVLAGANAAPGAGRLTAEELMGVDLGGTELVVLSACDTGRGRELTGQGVMGLQAAFAAAGARTLLMSLWKVPDESTALLMERFYHALWHEGARPAEALRRAQDALRLDTASHAPVHWAGWVLIGES